MTGSEQRLLDRIRKLEELLDAIRGLFPGAAPPVKEQIQYMLKWINEAVPPNSGEVKS